MEQYIIKFFDEFYSTIISGTIIGVAGYVLNYFRSLKKKHKSDYQTILSEINTIKNNMALNHAYQQKQAWRQAQSILLLAELVEEAANRNHKENPISIKEKINRLLRDSSNNL